MKYRELIKYTQKAKLILLSIFFTQSILPLLIGSNPRLILRNQPALTRFGRCEQYTIDLTVYLIITRLINGVFVENEVTCLGNRSAINLTSRRGRQTGFIFTNQLKKWRSRLSEDEMANGRNARKHKTFCSMDAIYVFRSIQ